ncbi:MAG: D-alanyl-D-alanine carboxypeptidase [Clostridia bacterium]|nr:D-alanyl-D-alanine carboxypeptidase [Clostridia bacterium]
MKRRRLISLLLVFMLLASPLCAFAADAGYHPDAYDGALPFSDSLYAADEIAGEARVTFEYLRAEQAVPDDMPEIGCRAAYLADPVSGKVFFEKNAHAKMYPASTTKILTALLVLENCDPDDMVTVSQRAIDLVPEGYTTAALQAGESLSVYVMLQALLIPSANDAAYALAEHVSGNIEAFASLCNDRAKALGCETLHFVNPNGVHDEDHYCSAYDLYLIAGECRKYDVFNEIVSTKYFTVPATDRYPRKDRIYTNTNELLLPYSGNFYADCTGIKTGHTTPAGECLVSSASRAGLDLICVVLGGRILDDENERFSDTITLLDYVYENYSYKKIADQRKPLAQVNIDNAVKDTPMLNVVLQTDIFSVAPNSVNEDNVITEIDLPEELKAPIQKHQVLGTVTYRVDGLIYSANMIAGNEVIKKPFWLYNLLVSLAAALMLLFVVAAVRRSARRKKRRAQRMKNSAQ